MVVQEGRLPTTWCVGPARARHLPIRRHGVADCVDDGHNRWVVDCRNEDFDDGDHLF